MKIRIFDLTRQYQILKDQLEPAVEAQMAGGSFIMGDAVHKFEESFAAYIGVKHAIALNSGTDALLISLRALGIGPGDEVITTPFTFFATVEPIVNVGATPVFADVNPDTYNIDPASIERKISSRTKAILPVHIFGQPAQMDEILRIAKQYGLKVIEDACQAVGSEFGGKKAGSLGDVGCFSFFPTKNLGAFGDGGMITTNDDRTETLCRAYLQHGMGQNGAKALSYLTGAPDELEGTAAPTGLYNPYKYFNYLVGYNSRLDALQATVLSIKLPYLDRFNLMRSQIAAQYTQGLKDCKYIKTPFVTNNVKPVWHQYALRCEHKETLMQYLASHGIGCAPFYPLPLHLQKALDYLGYQPGDLPMAEMISKQTVCLPVFPELTRDEIEYIIQTMCEFQPV
ncbi:MAG TPA: DegT/DnrJ/EryC1/StrS family aminotransferase [Candidatus Limiplasma sp.]|nr:DegT/DnrJ/EryC1/StrS family aminotransferase [Candidatus Limiplasma sp.]